MTCLKPMNCVFHTQNLPDRSKQQQPPKITSKVLQKSSYIIHSFLHFLFSPNIHHFSLSCRLCQTTLQLLVTGHLSLTCFLLSLTQQLCVDCLSMCFLQPFLWFFFTTTSLSHFLHPRSIYLISLSLASSLLLSAAKISM